MPVKWPMSDNKVPGPSIRLLYYYNTAKSFHLCLPVYRRHENDLDTWQEFGKVSF